jgi:hypothetical protein
LDDVEMHVKVAKFLDRTMWCHNPILRDKSDEGLLLKNLMVVDFGQSKICTMIVLELPDIFQKNLKPTGNYV